MKHTLFIALSAWAYAATAQAIVISDSPHAFGGSRLYVGNLSYDSPSLFDIFFDLSMEMGGPPLLPPAPGPPASHPKLDGVVILSSSLPAQPPGAPNPYPFSISFFDVFVELSPSGGTAFYDSEMLSLSLEGVDPLIGPFMIRESPTLPSLGHYSVEALASGQFRIDSFFDIFTELSLDGGQTWTPSQGPSRLTLMPEPSAIALLGFGGLLITRRRRKP
jgi:hypothetical protein